MLSSIITTCLSLALSLSAQTVVVDASVEAGPVKTLNGVNGGPCTTCDFGREMFKAARIPIARNHDLANKYDFGNFPYELKTDSEGTEITIKFDRRSFAYIELR